MCFPPVISSKPDSPWELSITLVTPEESGFGEVDLLQVSQPRLGEANSGPEHVAVGVDSSQQSGYERKEGTPGCMLSWRQGFETSTL